MQIIAGPVGNLDFVAGLPGSSFLGGPNKNTAVAVLGDLPVQFQDEITLGLIEAKPVSPPKAFRSNDPVFDRPPPRIAHDRPAVQVFAVEQVEKSARIRSLQSQ